MYLDLHKSSFKIVDKLQQIPAIPLCGSVASF